MLGFIENVKLRFSNLKSCVTNSIESIVSNIHDAKKCEVSYQFTHRLKKDVDSLHSESLVHIKYFINLLKTSIILICKIAIEK